MNKDATREHLEQALAASHLDFETFFMARMLGLEFAYTDDTCIVSFEVKEFMYNPQGGLHGGIIATVLDVSMGHLLKHKVTMGTTLEMKVQYSKAVRAGKLTATGRFLHQGRSICYLCAEMRDAEGDLVAHATATWKLRRDRHPAHGAPHAAGSGG